MLGFCRSTEGFIYKGLRLRSERFRTYPRQPTLPSDQSLHQPNSPMLKSHRHVVCDESGLEVASASRLLTSAQRGHSRRRTASIRIFGKSRRSGASSPDGEVAISSVDWSQRLRVLPMTGRVPLSRHVRTPWGAESIGRSRATDLEFESVVRARAASCVESPSRMTSQRGESGLFGNRSGIADRSGFGVASNRSC